MAGTSEILVTLPGGRRVDAQVGKHLVRTDQPVGNGGEDTATSPFELFLAAIGTCAGIFVQGFCAKRGLPTDGIRIRGSGMDTPARRRDEGRSGKRSMGRFTRSVPRNLRS